MFPVVHPSIEYCGKTEDSCGDEVIADGIRANRAKDRTALDSRHAVINDGSGRWNKRYLIESG